MERDRKEEAKGACLRQRRLWQWIKATRRRKLHNKSRRAKVMSSRVPGTRLDIVSSVLSSRGGMFQAGRLSYFGCTALGLECYAGRLPAELLMVH